MTLKTEPTIGGLIPACNVAGCVAHAQAMLTERES